MPQPLLLADTPHLLYRALLRAPGLDHRRRRPARSTRCWARSTSCCGASSATSRARSCAASDRSRPPTAPSSTRPTTPTARRCPTRSPTSGSARRRSTRRSAGRSPSHPDLEADDLMYAYAKAEVGGRRAARRSSPATATCSSAPAAGSRSCSSARARRGPDEMGPAEVEERYGIPPAAVPDFIALRGDPSDGLPGREGDRREDGRRPAAPPRHARGGDRRRGAREAGRAARADRAGRRAACVQGHRDAARRRRRAPAGPRDRPRGRRRRGARARAWSGSRRGWRRCSAGAREGGHPCVGLTGGGALRCDRLCRRFPVPPQLEAHYQMVLRALVEGRVIPLLGAGVNRCGRPDGSAWDHGRYAPDGAELAATSPSTPPTRGPTPPISCACPSTSR